MAKTRRSSVDNMFAKKGSVQPQKKDTPKEETIELKEPIEQEIKEETQEPEAKEPEAHKAQTDVSERSVTEETPVTEKEETPKEIEVAEEPKIEQPKKEPPVKKKTKSSRPSNIDGLFGKKKENGRTQSVYLKKEVYDFCNDIVQEYGIGMSEVINKLILSIMNDNEED